MQRRKVIAAEINRYAQQQHQNIHLYTWFINTCVFLCAHRKNLFNALQHTIFMNLPFSIQSDRFVAYLVGDTNIGCPTSSTRNWFVMVMILVGGNPSAQIIMAMAIESHYGKAEHCSVPQSFNKNGLDVGEKRKCLLPLHSRTIFAILTATRSFFSYESFHQKSYNRGESKPKYYAGI